MLRNVSCNRGVSRLSVSIIELTPSFFDADRNEEGFAFFTRTLIVICCKRENLQQAFRTIPMNGLIESLLHGEWEAKI